VSPTVLATRATHKENPAVASQSFEIPTMTNRRCVRAISACISDVPGVRTVEARLDTRTVRVTGTADPAAVRSAIRAAGHHATALPDRPEPGGGTDHHPTVITNSPKTRAPPCRTRSSDDLQERVAPPGEPLE
jgi:copper chaperone